MLFVAELITEPKDALLLLPLKLNASPLQEGAPLLNVTALPKQTGLGVAANVVMGAFTVTTNVAVEVQHTLVIE